MKTILIKLLRQCANELESGSCELNEDLISECVDYVSKIAHENTMSKCTACIYTGMSRSAFDNYVRLGLIPRGHKELGFKELRFYKSDLDKFLKTYKK